MNHIPTPAPVTVLMFFITVATPKSPKRKEGGREGGREGRREGGREGGRKGGRGEEGGREGGRGEEGGREGGKEGRGEGVTGELSARSECMGSGAYPLQWNGHPSGRYCWVSGPCNAERTKVESARCTGCACGHVRRGGTELTCGSSAPGAHSVVLQSSDLSTSS